MQQHINCDHDHGAIDKAAGDGVHHFSEAFSVFGKAGDHRRLQTENRHHGSDKVQHLGGGQDRTAQPAELHKVDGGYRHGVKGVQGRQINDAARIRKAGVCPYHQQDHAAHGDVQQEQQPRRCAVAAALKLRTAVSVADDQIATQAAKHQIIDRHRAEPHRSIADTGNNAEHHIEKIDRHTLIDADAAAESHIVQIPTGDFG